MLFGLKELIDPIAKQLQAASATIVTLLDGITEQQKITNDLLSQMRAETTRAPKSAPKRGSS